MQVVVEVVIVKLSNIKIIETVKIVVAFVLVYL